MQKPEAVNLVGLPVTSFFSEDLKSTMASAPSSRAFSSTIRRNPS